MWQPHRVLLMGVPTRIKVDGLDQAGAMHDWISSRDVHEVYYSGFGDSFSNWVDKVNQIRDGIVNDPKNPLHLGALFGNTWPRFYNTVSNGKTMNVINYQDKALPMFPIAVEAVIVLTNPQYRRQIKSNPNKLSWKAWYDARNIPVLFMNEQGIFDTN
jgi:hypothetical protein